MWVVWCCGRFETRGPGCSLFLRPSKIDHRQTHTYDAHLALIITIVGRKQCWSQAVLDAWSQWVLLGHDSLNAKKLPGGSLHCLSYGIGIN